MEGGRFLATCLQHPLVKATACPPPFTRSKGGSSIYNILSNFGIPLGIVSYLLPGSLLNRMVPNETATLYEFIATVSQGEPRRPF